jgi:hypothetical protein
MGHFCWQGYGGKATSLCGNYLVRFRVCAPYSPHLRQRVLQKVARNLRTRGHHLSTCDTTLPVPVWRLGTCSVSNRWLSLPGKVTGAKPPHYVTTTLQDFGCARPTPPTCDSACCEKFAQVARTRGHHLSTCDTTLPVPVWRLGTCSVSNRWLSLPGKVTGAKPPHYVTTTLQDFGCARPTPPTCDSACCEKLRAQVATKPTMWRHMTRDDAQATEPSMHFFGAPTEVTYKGNFVQHDARVHNQVSRLFAFLVRQRTSPIKGPGVQTCAREDVTFLHLAPHYLYRSGGWGHVP